MERGYIENLFMKDLWERSPRFLDCIRIIFVENFEVNCTLQCFITHAALIQKTNSRISPLYENNVN